MEVVVRDRGRSPAGWSGHKMPAVYAYGTREVKPELVHYPH